MADRLTDGTYQSHFLDISEPGAQISLQGADDMERDDLEEDGDNPDEEAVSVKTKKQTTRDQSSHSIPTQPPAMPASAIDQDLPVSYFDEDDDLTEFTSPAQESIAKECDVSYSVIIDTEVSCMTWWNRRV